jgi:hypothetical protein
MPLHVPGTNFYVRLNDVDDVTIRWGPAGNDSVGFNAPFDGSPLRVAFNLEDGNERAWVDGGERTTIGDSIAPNDLTPHHVDWGARVADNDFYYEGVVDDVCFFDSPLTDTEASSYNAPWK